MFDLSEYRTDPKAATSTQKGKQLHHDRFYASILR